LFNEVLAAFNPVTYPVNLAKVSLYTLVVSFYTPLFSANSLMSPALCFFSTLMIPYATTIAASFNLIKFLSDAIL